MVDTISFDDEEMFEDSAEEVETAEDTAVQTDTVTVEE
jgi:hypothetical protein